MTKYAQENDEYFQVQSLRLHSVVLKLLEGKRCLRHSGYGFISYRELWEAGKSAGIFQSFESPFAVMMDMLTVMEEGGLVERVRVSGGSWYGVVRVSDRLLQEKESIFQMENLGFS